MIFAPDSFDDDAYTAGLNQGMHVAFGAALALVFSQVGAIAIFVAWEAYQYWYADARKHDYYQDCMFWGLGVLLYQSEYIQVIIIACAGFWMLVKWIALEK